MVWQQVTGDYKGLQKTCFLTRTSGNTFSRSILHKKVTRSNKGLQGVTRGDRRLKEIAKDYRKRVF